MNEIQELKQTKTKLPDIKINTKALDIVNHKMPEIVEKTQAFGRTNSQSMLGLMTLTMLNGVSPMRLLRQVAAEIDRRRKALASSQVSLAKLDQKINKLLDKQDANDLSEVDEAKLRLFSTDKMDAINLINGALKDLASLIGQYDLIKKQHNIADDWSEADFEKEEMRFHVRRCFELLYRNMITTGRASEGTMEYLAQHGVHAQVAIREVSGFIQVTEKMIQEGNVPEGTAIEDFLDEMADKYEHCPRQLSMRLFGVEEFANYDIMYKKMKD